MTSSRPIAHNCMFWPCTGIHSEFLTFSTAENNCLWLQTRVNYWWLLLIRSMFGQLGLEFANRLGPWPSCLGGGGCRSKHSYLCSKLRLCILGQSGLLLISKFGQAHHQSPICTTVHQPVKIIGQKFSENFTQASGCPSSVHQFEHEDIICSGYRMEPRKDISSTLIYFVSKTINSFWKIKLHMHKSVTSERFWNLGKSVLAQNKAAMAAKVSCMRVITLQPVHWLHESKSDENGKIRHGLM